ncbi:putative conserved oligomeric Golgi complex subunit 7 isoform X1 [Penaeus vannamei]|uniref:Conserved oligomeric Golgi complex subunit 7 n=1 Tax=Penaeus vannamei TaxID=6689 RepID=A0A423TJ53_PENVA|nr:putative conserved oligomeric Golgi complex subunit 7 isoform X1 [Penaeus vannamei]
MQTLVKLDSLKGRLVASSQALREADNWTTLSTDIEEVMDSGDIDAIASKLVALQNCLGILTHVPDYEDRVAHLEGLKVRLEALASPHIVAAFTQHNLDESVKYARLLRSLGRVDQLESYYHKCEIGQLGTAWRNGVEGSQLSGPALWLTSFYDKLSLLISNQTKDGLLENSMTQSQAQCQSTVEVALHTIMNPVSSQLASLPDLPAWNSRQGTTSHLSLSFSPQEPSGRVVSESEVSAADFLINSVGQNTCKLYTDAILKIPEITTSMITQLTTDIDYICNILEDLGVTSCDPLDKLNLLLKAPVEQYWKIAPGNNPRLIAAVRQMRNIPVQS